MPTLSGVNLSLNALLAHSQAIEIIEHNVANANTVGYHRQEAVLRTTVPANLGGTDKGIGAGVRGTGVEISQIKRFTLDFFDTRYRYVTSQMKEWESQQDVLVQLERTLAENSSEGLLAKMDEFWNSWQLLSADPANTSLRAKLLDETQALVNGFNSRANSMNQLRNDQDLMISSRVNEINSAASRIAELNKEIARVFATGEQPNDMLDERDLLLDRLSELAGATSHVQQNGQVIVSISGHMLVTGNETISLRTVPDATNDNLLSIEWASGQPFESNHGELKGLLTARDEIIPAQLNGLNQLAVELRDEINAIHQTGYGLDGSTGIGFFSGDDALSLRMNPALTIDNLAAASVDGAIGDGSMAKKISELQYTKTMGNGTLTLNSFYNAQVTQLALDVQRAQINTHNQSLVQSAMQSQRESVTGVNLDEEAANMAKYQRAYQAAARVMTVYDTLLEQVINGMGLVGR